MSDESTSTLNAEDQDKLSAEYNELLKKSFKLLFVKKTLLSLQNKFSKDEELDTAFNVLRAAEFMDGNLLDLQEICNEVNLSYDKEEQIKKELWLAMQKRFDTMEPTMKKLKTDFPDLFDKKLALNGSKTPVSSTEVDSVLALDLERRENLQKLAEIQNRKLNLLKAAADVQLAPDVVDKLETMNLELSINQQKANLLRSYMINSYLSSTSHTINAVKKAEKHVDELLKDLDVDGAKSSDTK